jgi:putative redox protein
MPIETVQVDWVEDEVFLMRDRFGFPLVMAQPQGVNGADLLPLSLIGCSAWDVLAILRKQRQRVTGFQVVAESEREAEAPWRFRKIRIRYTIAGHGIRAAAVERAIELSESKYCSIYATLRHAIELVTEYELVDQTPPTEDRT